MFGYAAFAEAPFAALAEAGVIYDVAVAEGATGADSVVGLLVMGVAIAEASAAND